MQNNFQTTNEDRSDIKHSRLICYNISMQHLNDIFIEIFIELHSYFINFTNKLYFKHNIQSLKKDCKIFGLSCPTIIAHCRENCSTEFYFK